MFDGVKSELETISSVDDDSIEDVDRSPSASVLEEGGMTDVGLIQRVLSIK